MRVEDDLRPHNKKTIDNIMNIFQTEQRCCAIQATGTGKTYLILCLLEIFNDMGQRAIICAPNREIIKQTKRQMKRFTLSNAEFYTYQKLAITSIAELQNKNIDLIIVDEFHRIGAPTWNNGVNKLLSLYPNAKLFGVTATPIRGCDGVDMAEELFDNKIACNISLADAMVQGIIPIPPTYISALYTLDEEYRNMINKIEKNVTSIVERESLNGELSQSREQLEKAVGISAIIKKHISNFNGKYIVFTKNKKHLFAMMDTVVDWFHKAGCDEPIFTYPYYANDSSVKKNLDSFKANEEQGLKLLFVIDKLNEGLHLDNIDGCFLLRATGSNIVYFQQIGRVIDAGNNRQRVIFDLVCNFNSIKEASFQSQVKQAIERNNCNCSRRNKVGIDTFHLIDYALPCIQVFEAIDAKINSKCQVWTEKEDATLRSKYYKNGCNIPELGYRSKSAIRNRAKLLGLRTRRSLTSAKWTDEEVMYVKSHYANDGGIEISKHINKTPNQITAMAHKMGVRCRGKWYTDQEKEYVRKYYALYGVKRIAKALGRSESGIFRLAHALGVTYNAKLRQQKI